MSHELLPCPFCGGDANAKPHSQHLPGCYFDAMAQLKAAPKVDLSMAPEVVRSWNRRAAQPAAGDPVYQSRIKNNGEWRECSKQAYEQVAGYESIERRVLWTAPLAAAHGDEAVPNLVPGLQWAIDYCDAMLRQGNDRMLVEVIRKRLQNVRDNQPAAMRAQAGEVTGNSRLPAQAGEGGEAVRKDAQRYRYLRRKVAIVGGERKSTFHILNLEPRYVAPNPSIEFDAAIDAAMRAQAGDGEPA